MKGYFYIDRVPGNFHFSCHGYYEALEKLFSEGFCTYGYKFRITNRIHRYESLSASSHIQDKQDCNHYAARAPSSLTVCLVLSFQRVIIPSDFLKVVMKRFIFAY